MRFIKALNANEYTLPLGEIVCSQCYPPYYMGSTLWNRQVKTESELIAAMRMQRGLTEGELYICAGEAVLPAFARVLQSGYCRPNITIIMRSSQQSPGLSDETVQALMNAVSSPSCPKGLSLIFVSSQGVPCIRGAKGFQAIVAVLKNGCYPDDFALKLMGDPNELFVRVSAIAAVLQAGKCRKKLTLTFGGINDQGAKVLATVLKSGQCPNHLTLRLSGNYITDAAVQYFAEALESERCPHDLSLDFSNHIYNGVTAAGLGILAKSLRSGKCKPGLSIDYMLNIDFIDLRHLSFAEKKGLEAMVEALCSGRCPPGFNLNLLWKRTLIGGVSSSMGYTIEGNRKIFYKKLRYQDEKRSVLAHKIESLCLKNYELDRSSWVLQCSILQQMMNARVFDSKSLPLDSYRIFPQDIANLIYEYMHFEALDEGNKKAFFAKIQDPASRKDSQAKRAAIIADQKKIAAQQRQRQHKIFVLNVLAVVFAVLPTVCMLMLPLALLSSSFLFYCCCCAITPVQLFSWISYETMVYFADKADKTSQRDIDLLENSVMRQHADIPTAVPPQHVIPASAAAHAVNSIPALEAPKDIIAPTAARTSSQGLTDKVDKASHRDIDLLESAVMRQHADILTASLPTHVMPAPVAAHAVSSIPALEAPNDIVAPAAARAPTQGL